MKKTNKGLILGVFSHSRKENERRLPIHPVHFEHIEENLRKRIYLEKGYGEPFGVSDEYLSKLVAGLSTHEEIIANCDIILLPKPLAQDLKEMREGQILWGWPHCVQGEDITQIAIDKKLTLIAFEAMHYWSRNGTKGTHVFHQNNEMAGYCSVLHAMQLIGITGEYYRPLRAAIIGFGSTGRGAVIALKAHGVNDIHLLTQRHPVSVAAPIYPTQIVQFKRDNSDPSQCIVLSENDRLPMVTYLSQFDIVVNCVLQDPNAPLMFATEKELSSFRSGTLIVDVSCDEGMGFSWTRPTSFKHPMFKVGNNIFHYAVDHSPSLLWNSATWEISKALLQYIKTVLGGPESWKSDQVINHSIEISQGVIKNKDILSFQHRSPEYPHARLKTEL